LQRIIFAQEPQPFEFRLVADPGFKVELNSFDMAGWPHLDFASIASVSVEDGAGIVLASQSNVLIQGDAIEPQHTHLSFTGITAQELRIKFDSTTDGHGNVLDSDDVGLDNINFSQTPPGALNGDYNHNGIVDAADYTVWRDTLGQSGAMLDADGDHDGTVNAPDYGIWATNFGATPGSAAAMFEGGQHSRTANDSPDRHIDRHCVLATSLSVGRLTVRRFEWHVPEPGHPRSGSRRAWPTMVAMLTRPSDVAPPRLSNFFGRTDWCSFS
jgi:hypothetical protein